LAHNWLNWLIIGSIKKKIREVRLKKTAYNERFGVMAAGSPQKRQCELESLYPAGKAVEAATTPSRHHVVCKPTRAQWRKRWKTAELQRGINFNNFNN
jgi:hypothetical protein